VLHVDILQVGVLDDHRQQGHDAVQPGDHNRVPEARVPLDFHHVTYFPLLFGGDGFDEVTIPGTRNQIQVCHALQVFMHGDGPTFTEQPVYSVFQFDHMCPINCEGICLTAQKALESCDSEQGFCGHNMHSLHQGVKFHMDMIKQSLFCHISVGGVHHLLHGVLYKAFVLDNA